MNYRSMKWYEWSNIFKVMLIELKRVFDLTFFYFVCLTDPVKSPICNQRLTIFVLLFDVNKSRLRHNNELLECVSHSVNQQLKNPDEKNNKIISNFYCQNAWFQPKMAIQ